MSQCKNCHQPFIITDADREFYAKIDVPEPTFCPACREQRRLVFRNESTLYHNLCAKTGRDIISAYSPEAGVVVYDHNEWWRDDWDAVSYGREYNFSLPFFDQFKDLRSVVPHCSLWVINSDHCPYSNQVRYCKDCYLGFSLAYSENCLYCFTTDYSFYCVDCYAAQKHSELVYLGVDVDTCYHSAYLQECSNCNDCYFCYDCQGCSNCFGGVGLRNVSYHYYNQPLKKEDYEVKIQAAKLGSYAAVQKHWQEFEKFKLNFPRRFAQMINCRDCSGDHLKNCLKVKNSFDVYEAENINYSCRVFKAKDCWDVSYAATPELLYEYVGSGSKYRTFFSYVTPHSVDAYYSALCVGCKNIFGCVGLKNKQHCILNKQYDEKEYNQLLPRIIEQMKKTGEYGEFFPAKISPWGYNETEANIYYPLTKDEAISKGFKWRDNLPYTIGRETLKWQDVPDDIGQVEIKKMTGQVLTCQKCRRDFKLIEQELEFYQKQNIPLPRQCPHCRNSFRLELRNLRKLWPRDCSQCGRKIETTYAPDRPEKVYCEECYQKEIY